jgi:hypothetical protein
MMNWYAVLIRTFWTYPITFEYEQNEEVNGIFIQKLNKEIELEIERERDF